MNVPDVNMTGSSPRMWGLLPGHLVHGVRHRFIPTYVGFTPLPAISASFPAVHPHACGVYPGCGRPNSRASGSSPRMWGLRVPAFLLTVYHPVHPHACGVYTKTREEKCGNPLRFSPYLFKKVSNRISSLGSHRWSNSIPNPYDFPGPTPFRTACRNCSASVI